MAEQREDGCDANIQFVNSEYTQQWGATKDAFSVWSIRGQRQCCRIHRATGTYEWAIPADGTYDLAKAEATLRVNERWVQQNERSMQMMRTLKAKFEASLHAIDARIAALQEEENDTESDGEEELAKIRDLPMEVGVVGPRCGEEETAAPRRGVAFNAQAYEAAKSSDSGDDASSSSALDLSFLNGEEKASSTQPKRGQKRKNPPVDPFADARRLRLSLEALQAASQKSQGAALLAPPPAEPTQSPSSPPQLPSPPTQEPDTLPAALPAEPATQAAAPSPAASAEKKRPTRTVVPALPTLQMKSPAAPPASPPATAPSAPAPSSPIPSPLSSPSGPALASPAASPASPAHPADGDDVLASPVSPAQQAGNVASEFPADLPSPTSNPAIPSPDLGSGGAPAASASDEADSPLDLSFLDGGDDGDGDGDGDGFA